MPEIRTPRATSVAVLEVDPLGHRLRYVRMLLDAVEPARRLLLVSATVRDSAEFAEHLAPLDAPLVVVPDGSRAEAVRVALAEARAAGARLVVPDGDKAVAPLLAALARAAVGSRRRPRPPVSLLLMRTALPGGPEPATLGMAAKPALAAVLARVPGVRVRFLTDAFGVVTRRRGFPGIRPVRDPVTPPGRAAPSPGDGRAAGAPFRLGVFGVISARKNLPVLLAALAGAADDDPVAGAHLVVGGRCEPDVAALLAGSPPARALAAAGRLHVDDRLLSESEFDAAVGGVDAVAVLHDNDAPSGVVAEAAVRGVAVLGPARGWAAEMVTATGIGEVPAATDDPDAVRAALRRLIGRLPACVAATAAAYGRTGITDFVETLIGDTA